MRSHALMSMSAVGNTRANSLRDAPNLSLHPKTACRPTVTCGFCLTLMICRFLQASAQDSVDIHPRRFEPGICARKFLEDAQQGVVQEEEAEEEEEEQVVDAEGE